MVTGENNLTDGRNQVPPTLSAQWVGLLSGRADPASRVRATYRSGKEKGRGQTSAPPSNGQFQTTKQKQNTGEWGQGAESKGCQLWRNRQKHGSNTQTREKTSWLSDNPGVAARDLLARVSVGQRGVRGPTAS